MPSARKATKAAPRRSVPLGFGAFTGKLSGSPRRRASHPSLNGQKAQAGRCGVQMVAPRSISAWAKSPARRAGVRVSASARIVGFAAGNGSSRRTAARRCARYCRPPAWRDDRRRSRQSRRPYRRRCRATRATRFPRTGTPRRASAPLPARRHANCALSRNSRAPPRPSAHPAAARRPGCRTSGQRWTKRAKYGATVFTVVCCSMISDSQTRYGSGVSRGAARQGRIRRWRSYQASSTARPAMSATVRRQLSSFRAA